MTTIQCPVCCARNRVGPIPHGTPRCPRCKTALPWLVDADDASPGLAARFGARSIPLLVVLRDGQEVDRIVGALSRAALEQRLGPVLAAA